VKLLTGRQTEKRRVKHLAEVIMCADAPLRNYSLALTPYHGQSHYYYKDAVQPEQAMGLRVIGQWVEWVTFDGSTGSRVDVRSPMNRVCLFKHIIYHTFMIMDELEEVGQFRICCVLLTNMCGCT